MKRMFKSVLIVASFSIAAAATAQQAPPTPEERAAYATKVRESLMTLIGNNMGPLGAMARGRMPFNAELAKKNSMRLAQLAAMITDAFHMDTRNFDVETEALDGVWEDKDDFDSKAGDLVDAAGAFAAAARSGDQKTAMGEFRPVGGACKACHDDFREEHDD